MIKKFIDYDCGIAWRESVDIEQIGMDDVLYDVESFVESLSPVLRLAIRLYGSSLLPMSDKNGFRWIAHASHIKEAWFYLGLFDGRHPIPTFERIRIAIEVTEENLVRWKPTESLKPYEYDIEVHNAILTLPCVHQLAIRLADLRYQEIQDEEGWFLLSTRLSLEEALAYVAEFDHYLW